MKPSNPFGGPCARWAALCVGLLCSAAAWSAFPPPVVETTSDHPTFLFHCPPSPTATAPDYAAGLIAAYGSLPPALEPYALLGIGAGPRDPAARHDFYTELLPPLQEAGVPVAVQIGGGASQRYDLIQLEELLHKFTVVKGTEITGLRLDLYPAPSEHALDTPPGLDWLLGATDVAARYGRFTYAALDGLHWTRFMSNVACSAALAGLEPYRNYLIPGSLCRGGHYVGRTSSLLGFWLEDRAAQWGVSADSQWYTDAHFVEPGIFGASPSEGKVPSSVYRAQVLNGAMCGAAFYAFPRGKDLWFGPARHHWDEAILPTLTEVLTQGLIARKDFVLKRTRVAYQLAPSATPGAFHTNLRDIDGVLDAGHLLHGAYGMERPGQVPELVLNRGDRFWIPILSARATPEALQQFETVVQPGTMGSAGDWSALLDRYAAVSGEGSAFITQVGRGVFVMNTRENVPETQTFHIPALPAAVRGTTARREGDTIALSWPFREGDLAYNVYRRVLPATRFAPAASGLYERSYVDETLGPDATVAYAVTALTDEREPHQGAVGYGEYLTFSVVESRVAEEVVLSPLLSSAESTPIEMLQDGAPGMAWWPNYDGLNEDQVRMAAAIVERIEMWDASLTGGDLNGVLDLYSTEYEDPQGWEFQYVRRAYQWFFERYRAPRMHRQIRRWDFSAYETTHQVNLLLYCQITGIAITDPSGRMADQPIAIPRTKTAEVWLTWTDREGVWRLVQTNPAVPNFRDLLSYSAGPYDNFPMGPDVYQGE